jgi:uncharacterized protein YkwD
MAPVRLGRVAALTAVCFAASVANASALSTPGVNAPGRDHRSTCANTELMPTTADLKLIRAATLCLVNRERSRRSERPLRPNVRLRRAAQAHSRSMAFDDYFEHVGPRGQTPLARMRAVGYISSSRAGFEVGENIAWGTLSLATPHAIVASWMASPGHRANILDPHYRETGIGVSPHPLSSRAHGQAGAIYTQDFGVIVRG